MRVENPGGERGGSIFKRLYALENHLVVWKTLENDNFVCQIKYFENHVAIGSKWYHIAILAWYGSGIFAMLTGKCLKKPLNLDFLKHMNPVSWNAYSGEGSVGCWGELIEAWSRRVWSEVGFAFTTAPPFHYRRNTLKLTMNPINSLLTPKAKSRAANHYDLCRIITISHLHYAITPEIWNIKDNCRLRKINNISDF